MMKSIKEEWKNIEGFQSRYKISSFGNVLSVNYNKTGIPKTLKPFTNKGKYYQVVSLENLRVGLRLQGLQE